MSPSQPIPEKPEPNFHQRDESTEMIITAQDLRPGMVVLPFRYDYRNRGLAKLDLNAQKEYIATHWLYHAMWAKVVSREGLSTTLEYFNGHVERLFIDDRMQWHVKLDSMPD